MPGTCPNGAEIAPGYNQTTVALDAVAAGVATVLGISETVPWLFTDNIIGTIATSALCAQNLVDPGDFTLSLLATPPTVGDFPKPDATPGTLNRWIWDKVAYYWFHIGCVCSGTLTPPPAPIVITNPPGTDTSPSLPNNADQLTRIENNQQTSTDGLLTLYNGLQYTHAYAMNSWAHNGPRIASRFSSLQNFPMSGEGSISLLPWQAYGAAAVQIVYGVLVQLTSIPSSVAQRGTLTPRLYGVGSVMWDAALNSSHPKTITQRDSIHYQTQFIRAPRDTESFNLWWRLMPGVQATAYQLDPEMEDPFYYLTGPTSNAYAKFSGFPMPPGWTDSPFYPTSSSRLFAPFAALPP